MLEFNGLIKLIEECGELIQIAAKKVTCMDTDVHFDGKSLAVRLEDEIADVRAALSAVTTLFELDVERINERSAEKAILYDYWHNGGTDSTVPLDVRDLYVVSSQTRFIAMKKDSDFI